MSADLEKYRQKRDFGRTPEPIGGGGSGTEDRLRFVVQKHDARRLHYDLRLEYGGVLKSWAVPKEPGLTPKERRLAVRTEDHPLEYASFEGLIPEHEYGAGSVLIWDRGYWTPEGDPERGFAEGKLDFELHGEKLRGRWTLVRIEPGSQRRERQDNWLLIKRSDRKPAVATKARGSIRKTASREVDPSTVEGALREPMPAQIAPQLATLVAEVPSGDEWLLEPKLDGYRLFCRIEDQRVTLVTRGGNDWTDRFPAIADFARALPCTEALIDGEAVVFDAAGLTDFQRLQSAISERDPRIVMVAFDLLQLDGWDLRAAPLQSRKALLQALLADEGGTIRYGEHIAGHGDAFFKQACELGLEGIIAKRAMDPYREERTRSWRKLKCLQNQDFVIVGYTDPRGSRMGFGALLLGIRDRPGEPLRYAGRVGTGFDQRLLQSLYRRLSSLERTDAPIGGQTPLPLGEGIHWVEPELVAEVTFREWTADGVLRHSSFRGLRADKASPDVTEERPLRRPDSMSNKKRVKISHPDKLLFPVEGITKRQLADYWENVAAVALPFISLRPLTLLRCPEGVNVNCFYQKHIGAGVPDALARIAVEKDGDPYAMVDDAQGLIGLAQMEVIEVHVWGSRATNLDRPDIIVFDLDPSEELAWSAVVDAAFDVKNRLESLGLVAFARLTGGKALHVVVPVVPGPDWRSVKHFSRTFAREMVRTDPQRYTASMSKARRVGKIFIDYYRNERGSTAIASYSPRARPGAPVALPIEWSELDGNGDAPPTYGLLEVPDLLRVRGLDPWRDFEVSRRSLTD